MVNSLEGQVKRFAKRQENKATLKQYTYDTKDDYGDPDWNDPSESTIYILESETNPQPQSGEQGDSQEIDVRLQIDNSVKVQDEDMAPDSRADEIDFGHRTFRVVNVKEKMGIKLVDGIRLDNGN